MIRTLSNKFLPCKRNGDYAQSLMDLGSLVCIPRAPRCKSCPVIFACKLGGRSARAQMQLNMLGFKNVINLSGGITDYKGETV